MKSKQYLIIAFVLSIVSIKITAQVWTTMAENVIPANFRTWSLKIAEDSSMWAISTYDRFPPLSTHLPKIHRSINGAEWSTFTFSDAGGQYGQDISAVDKLNAFVGIGKRIYKTTDGGISWTKMDAYKYALIALHFFNKNEGWAFGNDTIAPFKQVISLTTNGGTTWAHIGTNDNLLPTGTSINSAIPNVINLEDFLADGYSNNSAYSVVGETIILGKRKTVWISRDKGYNWKVINSPLFPKKMAASTVAQKDSLNFMIAADSDYSTYAAKPTVSFATTDGGNNWIEGAPQSTSGAMHYIPNTPSTYIMTGHNNFGSGAPGTYITYNSGRNWAQLDNTRILSLSFNSKGQGLGACCNNTWFGTAGRLFRWAFQLPVSTAELSNNIFFSINPNPTQDVLNLQFEDALNVDAFDARISDVAGKVVFQTKTSDKQLIIKHLQSGIYFLTVKIKDKIGVVKFIKN
jgi:photosystem II stability/assembly factor-like uncharacterized protein